MEGRIRQHGGGGDKFGAMPKVLPSPLAGRDGVGVLQRRCRRPSPEVRASGTGISKGTAPNIPPPPDLPLPWPSCRNRSTGAIVRRLEAPQEGGRRWGEAVTDIPLPLEGRVRQGVGVVASSTDGVARNNLLAALSLAAVQSKPETAGGRHADMAVQGAGDRVAGTRAVLLRAPPRKRRRRDRRGEADRELWLGRDPGQGDHRGRDLRNLAVPARRHLSPAAQGRGAAAARGDGGRRGGGGDGDRAG